MTYFYKYRNKSFSASTHGQSLSTQRYILTSSRFPINMAHMPWHHSKLQGVVSITTHSVMPSRMGLCVVYNSGTSQTPSIQILSDIEPSHVHIDIVSFMDSLPNSECMIRPLTQGLGRNVRTLIPSDAVLKKTISKEVARDIRLAMLALKTFALQCSPSLWHACATW